MRDAQGLTRHKISDRARERAWLQAGGINYTKATHQNEARFVASHYRLTRVVRDLRSGAFRRLPHRQRQIVNNSATTKTLSVDKSARLIFFQPEDTHRPATNMHRKQSLDYFNQSFGRARCAPVRQTNSHLPTRFQRLDYKAFAEREQCVLPIKRRSTQHKKKENSHDSKPILRSLHWPG